MNDLTSIISEKMTEVGYQSMNFKTAISYAPIIIKQCEKYRADMRIKEEEQLRSCLGLSDNDKLLAIIDYFSNISSKILKETGSIISPLDWKKVVALYQSIER